MTSDDNNIVCIKVGDKYSATYVNRLAAAIAKHTTVEHRFLCLTDNPKGLTCEASPIGTQFPGWWAKLMLFKPHPDLKGKRFIFLDLDTVIVDNIDFMFTYTKRFAILRDFYVRNGYGSAVMAITPSFGDHIWTSFEAHATDIMRNYHGDQDWIRLQIQEADLWQDIFPKRIVSYKVHCQQALPKEAAIVCFHGDPKPHAVEPRPNWLQENWNDL